ncbi:hypothetical protein CEXT_314101 [Caerostris extrusa]|uniref:Secreted protein n=1 Tax=Caerostris extrusa TaxID=172846 RepID=A0AAV4PCS5_CAEEX|nr:hypothetical protein CEXT_314101 [Caerostris extrusa]
MASVCEGDLDRMSLLILLLLSEFLDLLGRLPLRLSFSKEMSENPLMARCLFPVRLRAESQLWHSEVLCREVKAR